MGGNINEAENEAEKQKNCEKFIPLQREVSSAIEILFNLLSISV